MQLVDMSHLPVNSLIAYAPITGPRKVSLSMTVSLTLRDGNVLRLRKTGWICMGKVSQETTGNEAFAGYVTMMKAMRANYDRTVKFWKQTTPNFQNKCGFDIQIDNPVPAPPGTELGYYEIDPRWTELS